MKLLIFSFRNRRVMNPTPEMVDSGPLKTVDTVELDACDI